MGKNLLFCFECLLFLDEHAGITYFSSDFLFFIVMLPQIICPHLQVSVSAYLAAFSPL